jgi:hypothetical protein
VICGGGVVSVGVGRFVCAYGHGFLEGWQVGRFEDEVRVSFRIVVGLFDVRALAQIAKWQRAIFADTRRYSATT